MQEDGQFDVLSAIERVHGKVATSVHEDVIGRLPTQHEQDLLKIVRQSPVLGVHRIHYADGGTPIMYSRVILVASYFVLSYDYNTAPALPE